MMYSLNEDKATVFKKKLQNGEVFLKYEKETDKIIYLADLPKKKAKKTQKEEESKGKTKNLMVSPF